MKIKIHVKSNRWAPGTFPNTREGEEVLSITQERLNNALSKLLLPDVAFTPNPNLKTEKGKFSYQFGLRGEYSQVVTELIETNELNDRNYFNLFPSAFFNYEFSEKDAIQLSYSRRIQRPRFWYLNPFFTYNDRRNLFSGNPNLNPEFTDSYELNYLFENHAYNAYEVFIKNNRDELAKKCNLSAILVSRGEFNEKELCYLCEDDYVISPA